MNYEFIEERHADAIDSLDVLFMPWCQVLRDELRQPVARLLRRGGTLLVEAEADAFTTGGFYRPPEQRPLMQALGLHDLGRRPLPPGEAATLTLGGQPSSLPLQHFCTPLEGDPRDALATGAAGEHLLIRRSVGEGRAYVLGGFAGRAYYDAQGPGLDKLLRENPQQRGSHRRVRVRLRGARNVRPPAPRDDRALPVCSG